MDVITIPYSPRESFRRYHNRDKRWAVIVAHRRCGKTVACINDLIRAALTSNKENPRFAYLAPYYAQAKDVAWDYLKHYAAPIPGTDSNESELRLDLPNGARIRLYGAENADRMRGVYLDGIVIDEPADIRPNVWPEIIRPALSDRMGWATWIGTPKGKNAFWDLWDAAQYDDDWYTLMLKASETGYVSEDELMKARKVMSEDQYAQEYECSFDAAIQGAYYAKLIQAAENEGRICELPWKPGYPVHTGWDIGYGDKTSLWFAQQVGDWTHIIDYYEMTGMGPEHFAKVLKEKPYVYGDHIWPHDMDRGDWGSGKARPQVMAGLGIYGRILDVEKDVNDGIAIVRMLLPNCKFDKVRCADGLEALRQYRTEYDEKHEIFRPKPLHDWASDAADAFRYLARGLPDQSYIQPKRDRYTRDRKSSGSAWARL